MTHRMIMVCATVSSRSAIISTKYSIVQLEPYIPADTQNDSQAVKATMFEQVVSKDHAGDCR